MKNAERKIREKIDEVLTPDIRNIPVLYGPPPLDSSKEKKLLSQCLFYKGEEICPYKHDDGQKALYWDYERVWVEWELDFFHPELEAALDHLEAACPYAAKDNPDVPLGLQAIFVNRIEHWSGERITRLALRQFIKQYKQAAGQ